jgi:hypothetical protein
MALNLNKGDKNTRAVPGSSKSSKGFNLDKKGSENPPTINSEAKSEGGNKNSNFIFLILGVLIVAGGIFWALNKDGSGQVVEDAVTSTSGTESGGESPITTGDTPPADTMSVAANQETQTTNIESGGANIGESGNTTNGGSTNSSNNPTSNSNIGGSSQNTTNNVASNTTTQVQGSVEETARKVINGEFGNGSNRKRLLGNDYAAIQAKVNELYRLGKQ